MAKSHLTARWSDPEFLQEVGPTLESIFVNKALAGAVDIRGITIGLDGEPPGLRYPSFQALAAQNINASECRVSCSFGSAKLFDSNFDKSKFDTCWFKEAYFERTTFDDAKIDSPTLDDAKFIHCSFSGARIHGRRIQEYGGRRVVFEDCDFRDMLFRNVQLRACRFLNCNFEGTRFEKCLIVGVKFEGSSPAPSAFVGCEVP